MGDNNFNIGNNPQNKDLIQAQQGDKKEIYKNDPAMLEVFNASDTNKNGVLDSQQEISLFNQKAQQAKQAQKEEENIPFFLRRPEAEELPKTELKTQMQTFNEHVQFQEKLKNALATPENDAKLLRQQSVKQQAAVLAQKLYKIADDHTGAVSRSDFQAGLSEITPENVVDFIKQYNEISPDESVLEMICDEKGNTDAARKAALSTVYNKLLARGKQVGLDENNLFKFKSEFNKEMNIEFRKIGFIDTKNMDTLMYGLVQAIDNTNSLSYEEKDAIGKEAKIVQQNNTLIALQDKVSGAEKAFQAQQSYDGWIGKMVDGMSAVWGSENRAKLVKNDINTFKNQINELNNAKNQGEVQFENKFYEIFKVNYDPVQMAAYKKQHEKFGAAAAFHNVETQFNSQMEKLISSSQLRSEEKYSTTPDGITVTVPLASKEEVYFREVGKFAKFLGQGDITDGALQIDKALEAAGIDKNAPLEDRYRAISQMAKQYSAKLHEHTMKATEGKGFDSVKKEFDASYTATFGAENDVARRVEEYNISQQTGTAVAKGAIITVGATIIGTVTGGSGLVPMLAAAGGTTALSATVGLTDRASSDNGLSMDEAKKIVTNSAIDGATMLVSGGGTYIAQMSKMGKAASYALRTSIDTAADMGAEYLQTGKVTLESTAISAISSFGGQYAENIMASKKAAGVQQTTTLTDGGGVSPRQGVIPEMPQTVPSPKDYNVEANLEVVARTRAEDTNNWWKAHDYDNPPYLPNSEVQHVCLEKETTFVRTFDGENSGMYGGWVMDKKDIIGLTPQQIQDKFALPQCPKFVADVTLEKGTVLRRGICNPLEGWGNGGGVQYDLQCLRKGKFDNPRPLSELK